MTKEEAIKLITFAFSCYPSYQEKDPEPIVKAWAVMLADIPYPDAQKAVMKHATISKFFPSIAEIRESVFIRQNSLPTPEEAWAEVRKVLENGSNYINYTYSGKEPEWSNEVLRQTVNAIGIRELFKTENVDVMRAHFTRFYESYRNKAAERRNEEAIGRLTDGRKMIQG